MPDNSFSGTSAAALYQFPLKILPLGLIRPPGAILSSYQNEFAPVLQHPEDNTIL